MMREQNRILQAQMAQTENKLQASIQEYIRQNRPRLEQEHQQYMQQTGMHMSLEQFVRGQIEAEAARRNAAAQPAPNPIFEQQQRSFQASQQAHFARQQKFDNQNQAWSQNQQQIDNNNQAWAQGQRQIDSNHNRFIQQGIQGNQYYESAMLASPQISV